MLISLRARALAQLGHVQEAVAAISEADVEFSVADLSSDLTYARDYSAAEHAGETGFALAELAEHGYSPGEANTRLTEAASGFTDTYARSRAFAQIRHASLLMTTGDPREASRIGMEALDAAGGIRSRRISDKVRELGTASTPHAKINEVAELRGRIDTVATA